MSLFLDTLEGRSGGKTAETSFAGRWPRLPRRCVPGPPWCRGFGRRTRRAWTGAKQGVGLRIWTTL